MTRYHPGDIIEIHTDKGLAYVHLTHEHDSYPPVVRVMKGVHVGRPADIAAHVARAPRLTAMIPLEQALDRLGLAHEKVGTVELPEGERKFPTFRMPIRDKQGEIVYWWFWDGKGLSYSVELDAIQETLPLREVMSAARLLRELMTPA
jgi:hypothetical protein